MVKLNMISLFFFFSLILKNLIVLIFSPFFDNAKEVRSFLPNFLFYPYKGSYIAIFQLYSERIASTGFFFTVFLTGRYVERAAVIKEMAKMMTTSNPPK